MSETDPPIVNARKALRDATQLHRRLSWMAACRESPRLDEAKRHVIAAKEALIAEYEALGGTWDK